MPAWFLRLKVEQYLGVEPLFLVNHPHGEELFEQALDAMFIESEVEKAFIAEAKRKAGQSA